MANPVNVLRQMSVPPIGETSLNNWLQLQDAVSFRKDNARDDLFVLYANLPNVYIHAMLVPSKYVLRQILMTSWRGIATLTQAGVLSSRFDRR